MSSLLRRVVAIQIKKNCFFFYLCEPVRDVIDVWSSMRSTKMCCSIKKVSATVTICTGISRIRPQCPYNSEVAFYKVITNNKGGELIPMSTTTTTTMATHDYRIRLQCDPMTILMIVVSKYIKKIYYFPIFHLKYLYIYIYVFSVVIYV